MSFDMSKWDVPLNCEACGWWGKLEDTKLRRAVEPNTGGIRSIGLTEFCCPKCGAWVEGRDNSPLIKTDKWIDALIKETRNEPEAT